MPLVDNLSRPSLDLFMFCKIESYLYSATLVEHGGGGGGGGVVGQADEVNS